MVTKWSGCRKTNQQELSVVISTLSLSTTSYGGLTPWNPVGRQFSRNFGALPHGKFWSRTRWHIKSVNNISTSPYVQYARPMGQELTYHLCQAQVKCLNDCIHLQHPRWWNHIVFVVKVLRPDTCARLSGIKSNLENMKMSQFKQDIPISNPHIV